MTKFISYLTVLFFCGFIFSYAQPKLEIEGNGMYDWGNVKPEEGVLHADVKLWNRGDKPLEILRTKPGCGCTTDSLDMKTVPPGKYATLKVHLRIVGYQGNTMKSVRISTNDPEKPEQNLLLKCNVVVPVVQSPRYLGFNKLVVGEEATTKSVLTNNTTKPLKIKSFTLSVSSEGIQPNELKHNLRRNIIIEPQATYTIEMKYKPKKAGRLQANLDIETDNKENSKINYPIWGNMIEK